MKTLMGVAAILLFFLVAINSAAQTIDQPNDKYVSLTDVIKNIETRLKARVGVAVHEPADDMLWLYRADERFPMCSTFKTLACAALLYRIDKGEDSLDRFVPISLQHIASYSPVTELHVGGSMSLFDLCAATMKTSDNTAANLILDAIGGPASLTAFIRMSGDLTTRLDRRETDLNEATPGDFRDTTTPSAMARTVERLVLGQILSPKSRQQLKNWMLANEVAGKLIRAGVPVDWIVADRSGAGGHGSRAIVAIMWPPKAGPIVAAIYLTETEASFDERNAAIAEIGRFISREITRIVVDR
ncbi:MAG TPA: class A beta-lactamase [Candidatus Rifleibacterium sp.]|nr:class A beta-lactamase [Candidatus Rifleibacterium sp.]HPT47857.1 class A beta-lactamase [Candidatus Rifleibacterium sp.]